MIHPTPVLRISHQRECTLWWHYDAPCSSVHFLEHDHLAANLSLSGSFQQTQLVGCLCHATSPPSCFIRDCPVITSSFSSYVIVAYCKPLTPSHSSPRGNNEDKVLKSEKEYIDDYCETLWTIQWWCNIWPWTKVKVKSNIVSLKLNR